jgi:hypothetical protein
MDILDQDILLDEKDVLITIWTKPKLTLGYILKYCPNKYVNVLLMLGGVTNAVNLNYQHFVSDNSFSATLFMIVMVLGGILGWIFSYIYAALLSWTGEWLNGQANTYQFLTVIAWSAVPTISSLILMIPNILMMGDTKPSFSVTISYYLIAGLEIAVSTWSTVILIKGISLVQKFKIGKAILNACLPLIVIIVPILMIIGLIYIFK